VFFRVGALLFPREFCSAAEIEELEGALGAAARGDVSVIAAGLGILSDWNGGGEVHMSQVLRNNQAVVPY
jgi:hypothetical protein